MYTPEQNIAFMQHAVALAERGRFVTAPNPCVGAVLVQNGHIVAEGWHQYFGGAHAEVNCLRDAAEKGVSPQDCTLFVTLEPCNHTGKTPPCSHAVLKAGIRHVVIGMRDPNPVAKGGAEFLRENGVTVDELFCPTTDGTSNACAEILREFTHWQKSPLPFCLVKLASTLDGRIAARTGHSQWISCDASRARVHELRANVSAVIVGGNTFRKDNPQLTFRSIAPHGQYRNMPYMRSDGTMSREAEVQPLAVIVTRHLPAATDEYFLLQKRPQDTIFWTDATNAASDAARALQHLNVRVWALPLLTDGGLDLRQGLVRLRQEEACQHVLCEGGGELALSLLQQELAQEVELHIAPKILADNSAKPLFNGLSPQSMDEALQLSLVQMKRLGNDCILTLRPRKSA